MRDDRIRCGDWHYELTLTGGATRCPVSVHAGEHLGDAPRRAAGCTVGVRPVGAPGGTRVHRGASLAPGWLALTRDPRPLLGLASPQMRRAADLLARRDESFAAGAGLLLPPDPRRSSAAGGTT